MIVWAQPYIYRNLICFLLNMLLVATSQILVAKLQYLWWGSVKTALDATNACRVYSTSKALEKF